MRKYITLMAVLISLVAPASFAADATGNTKYASIEQRRVEVIKEKTMVQNTSLELRKRRADRSWNTYLAYIHYGLDPVFVELDAIYPTRDAEPLRWAAVMYVARQWVDTHWKRHEPDFVGVAVQNDVEGGSGGLLMYLMPAADVALSRNEYAAKYGQNNLPAYAFYEIFYRQQLLDYFEAHKAEILQLVTTDARLQAMKRLMEEKSAIAYAELESKPVAAWTK